MNFLLEIVRLGLHNLRLHKLRSMLTSLGIILGVAAVIVMVSIGEGNKQAALREIQALGATNIIVRSIRPPESSSFGSQERSFAAKFGITRQDWRRLEHFMTDAASLVRLKKVGDEITYREKRMISQAHGTTPVLLDVTSLKLARGRYLTSEDVASRAAVAVIGAAVAEKFFRLTDPIGQTFRIGQIPFRVVGVLKPVGLAGGTGSKLVGRDLNLDVHIPLSTAEIQFGDIITQRQSGSFSDEEIELSEVYVTASSTETVLDTAARVRRLMSVEHEGLTDIQIIVPWELLENAKRTALVWNIVLIAVAAISLLIGGIGIMNIMLASVTERIREIGIRRALGATRQHIIAQFLVETGTLSTLGGIFGIGLGILVSVGLEPALPRLLNLPLIRRFFDSEVQLETQVTGWSVLVSFIVAAFVGLLFGIYPAVVASRQDPIVALRHD